MQEPAAQSFNRVSSRFERTATYRSDLGYPVRSWAYDGRMPVGPLDFWDTLATVDWSARFEPFDDDQMWRLRRYSELAHELGKSTFFSAPIEFSFKASAEESYERLDHAGDDALRSMAMSFRQLWEDGEPAQFQTVRNLLRAHLLLPRDRVDTRLLLDVLGQRYRGARREVMMKDVWEDDPIGEPKAVIRAEQVVNDWLYSGPFHGDKDKIARVARWSDTAYELSLIKAINGITGVIWEMQIVVMGATGELSVAAA